jgi:hypothetical protein
MKPVPGKSVAAAASVEEKAVATEEIKAAAVVDVLGS